MNTIWKFPLESAWQELSMPPQANILCVQMQGEVPCLWAVVDPYTTERVHRRFNSRPTGEVFEGDPGKYIGTVQMRSGLVFHVFEV